MTRVAGCSKRFHSRITGAKVEAKAEVELSLNLNLLETAFSHAL
jgi:hypothetical protein